MGLTKTEKYKRAQDIGDLEATKPQKQDAKL